MIAYILDGFTENGISGRIFHAFNACAMAVDAETDESVS
jgi:hypothetical protein